jgi:hypothetical protein
MSRVRATGGRLLAVGTVVLAVALAVPGLAYLRHPIGSHDGAAPPQPDDGPAASALETGSGVGAERQSRLLAGEDHRLLTLVTSVRQGSAPYVQELDGTQTLVLTPGGLDYGLPDLIAHGAAQVEADGAVLITTNVFVAPGARLTISAPGTTLHLRSTSAGSVSLVAWKAGLTLAGADEQPLTVVSWDPESKSPDTTTVDGRAYVREVSGDLAVRHVAASDLGFWAGRTSGVAWTGSSRRAASGQILDSTFRRNHYGAFASESQGITVAGSDFSDNAVDGLSLHRRTADTTVENSAARGNGRHGFSADQGSESVEYTDVTAERNRAYGFFFSGTPLSAGQSAGGASLRAYGRLHLTGGVARHNGSAGIRVVGGHDVSLVNTRVVDNTDGIMLAGTTAPTTIEHTTISAHRFGISVSRGTATVRHNRLSGSETAIRVRDATVSVTGNQVRGATAHAISVVGASAGSSVRDNHIGGRGPSGLDLYRVADRGTVDVSGNDVRGWTRDRDDLAYWSTFIPNHPMLLLWVVGIGLPLLLTARARHAGPRAPGALPYPDHVRPGGSAPVRVNVGRRITGGQT